MRLQSAGSWGCVADREELQRVRGREREGGREREHKGEGGGRGHVSGGSVGLRSRGPEPLKAPQASPKAALHVPGS